jgi:hypothetical protein
VLRYVGDIYQKFRKSTRIDERQYLHQNARNGKFNQQPKLYSKDFSEETPPKGFETFRKPHYGHRKLIKAFFLIFYSK